LKRTYWWDFVEPGSCTIERNTTNRKGTEDDP